MKKNLLSLFFLSLCINCFSQSTIDVLHYRFEIKLTDLSDTIYGRTEIKFRLIENKNNQLWIDLKTKDVSGKGMVLTEPIRINNIALKTKIYDQQINLDLPASIKTGDTATAIIYYKGIPADGLIISKNKFGKRTFFSDNWPDRAHNWIPCVDNPSDKASVEFAVTAPAHYQVISNGIQVEESNLANNQKLTVYREDQPLPTKIMVIGVAEFAVSHAGLVDNCIPVSNWVFPENKLSGFADYAMTRDILEYFTNYIAPYPYRKLANVQSKTIFGGMENAGAIFYFENSVDGLKDQETLFAHEIVHQWFGDMATEKSFAHLWLSEGFATYLTHLHIESKYGTDSLRKRMEKDRNEVLAFVRSAHRPVVDSTKDLMSLLNDNSYQKGSWVLHMLRHQLGDSLFHASIRLYYQSYGGKNADTKDLQKIFEQVSRQNLETFFHQWLYLPENPSLKINWQYMPDQQIRIHVTQLQRNMFEFPLELEFTDVNGKKTLLSYTVDKKENEYFIKLPGKQKLLVADPHVALLFSGTVN
jgi:aminopeptidase N